MLYAIDYKEAVLPAEIACKRQKVALLILIAIPLLFQLVFGESLMANLSTSAKFMYYGLLISLAGKIFFHGDRSDRIPSALRIEFYEDYIVLYREKRAYSTWDVRRECAVITYDDNFKIQYSEKNYKVTVHGTTTLTQQWYRKDGTLKERVRKIGPTQLFWYFYTYLDDRDILGLLEKYTPATVESA